MELFAHALRDTSILDYLTMAQTLEDIDHG